MLPKPLSPCVHAGQEGGGESSAAVESDGKPQQILEGRESGQVSGGSSEPGKGYP